MKRRNNIHYYYKDENKKWKGDVLRNITRNIYRYLPLYNYILMLYAYK